MASYTAHLTSEQRAERSRMSRVVEIDGIPHYRECNYLRPARNAEAMLERVFGIGTCTSAPHDTGVTHGPLLFGERHVHWRGCLCPDDCNCRHPWRHNFCGCAAHVA